VAVVSELKQPKPDAEWSLARLEPVVATRALPSEWTVLQMRFFKVTSLRTSASVGLLVAHSEKPSKPNDLRSSVVDVVVTFRNEWNRPLMMFLKEASLSDVASVARVTVGAVRPLKLVALSLRVGTVVRQVRVVRLRARHDLGE
jgi:hypothetical protein